MFESLYTLFLGVVEGFSAVWEFLSGKISDFSFDFGDDWFSDFLESILETLQNLLTTVTNAIGLPDASWLDLLIGVGLPVFLTLSIIRWLKGFIF